MTDEERKMLINIINM